MNLSEWKAFLDLYVADQVPTHATDPQPAGTGADEGDVFGADLAVEPVPYADYATVEEARAAYEAEKPVRLILESGR